MRQRDCDNCGESYAIGNASSAKSISAKYCSDTCRYAAANERKKLYRQANASAEYIQALVHTAESSNNAQNKRIADNLVQALVHMAIHRNLSEFDSMVSAIKSGKSVIADHPQDSKRTTGYACLNCGHFHLYDT